MRGCIRKAHREYTSKMEAWQEKLPRAAGAVVLGHETAAKAVSEERNGPVALGPRSGPPPLNGYLVNAPIAQAARLRPRDE